MRMNKPSLDALEKYREGCEDDSVSDYIMKRSLGIDNVTRSRQNARRQYVNICPSATLYEQETSACLKRFSTTGKYLIGFGRSSHSIFIYKVCFCGSAEPTTSLTTETFFTPSHEVVLCAGSENLSRDFCLFTPDDQYMILASAESSPQATTTNGGSSTGSSEVRDLAGSNPHSLTGLSSLDDIRFHIVHVESGKITDRLKFSQDYILLSHHAGVSMSGRKFALLSLQNQIIKIYYIDRYGRFIPHGSVGYTLYEDEQVHLAQGLLSMNSDNGHNHDNRDDDKREDPTRGGEEEVMIGDGMQADNGANHHPPSLLLGLRQRLFSFLYQRALKQLNPTLSLRLLYNNWNIIENLCISRFQFLDDSTLLLKLSCPESLCARSRTISDNGVQNTSFFTVYSIAESQIKSFHRGTSSEFYEAVRDYNDFVRIKSSMDSTSIDGIGICWQSTPSNNEYERQIWQRNVQLLAASRPSQGELYAAKRLLLSLPYSPQNYSDSPYLDSNIFRSDERSVSASERQKSASEFPVRFFSRKSDRVAFKLDSGVCPETGTSTTNSTNPYRVKKYTQWIFHPYLPLVISSQHTLIRSNTVNIHYRPAYKNTGQS